jgi:hypothetical protein
VFKEPKGLKGLQATPGFRAPKARQVLLLASKDAKEFKDLKVALARQGYQVQLALKERQVL